MKSFCYSIDPFLNIACISAVLFFKNLHVSVFAPFCTPRVSNDPLSSCKSNNNYSMISYVILAFIKNTFSKCLPIFTVNVNWCCNNSFSQRILYVDPSLDFGVFGKLMRPTSMGTSSISIYKRVFTFSYYAVLNNVFKCPKVMTTVTTMRIGVAIN